MKLNYITRLAFLSLLFACGLSACKKDKEIQLPTCQLLSQYTSGDDVAYAPPPYLESYNYDSQGRLTKITATLYRLGYVHIHTVEYNNRNQIVKFIKFSNTSSPETFQYEYDSQGRWSIITRTRVNTVSTEYFTATYDAEGNLSLVEMQYRLVYDDKKHTGERWHYEYENGNLVKKTIDKISSSETNTYEYYSDEENKLRDVERQLAILNLIPPASKNLMKKEKYAAGGTAEFTYEFNDQGFPISKNFSFPHLNNNKYNYSVTFDYQCR